MEPDELEPRVAPRNVPTLTEVMTHGDALPPPADSAPVRGGPEPAMPIGAAPAIADAAQMLARLGPDLDQQIAEAIGRVLHEQLLGLNVRVRKAVAEVVREAVAKAIAQDAHGPDVGSNP